MSASPGFHFSHTHFPVSSQVCRRDPDGQSSRAEDNSRVAGTNTRLGIVAIAHSGKAWVVLDSDSGNRGIETFPWSCICGRVEQSSRQDNLWDDLL